MKKIVLAAAYFLFAHVAMAQPLSQDERQYVVELLEANANKFLANIEHISDEQWRFKPASNVWSVSEVSEHIALSEDLLLSIVEKTCWHRQTMKKRKDWLVMKINCWCR